MSDRILVTGGAGFIGSAAVRELISSTDHRVVNVDCLTYAGDLESLASVEGSPRYVFERVDVCDAPEVRRLFAEHAPAAILHFAAESHVDRSIDGPARFVETNVLGTFTLLEAARDYLESHPSADRGRFRFVHVSTDEVFGSLGATGRFVEESAYAPNSPYAASKAAADCFVRAWGRTYGLPVVITNCSNNYGPFQFPEKLIPQTIIHAIEGREIPVYGDGRNVRDWIFVEDHVSALLSVLEGGRQGATYLIGADCERENLTVVRAVCHLLDRLRPRVGGGSYEEQVVFVADRPGHDRRYALDGGRMRKELGWRPVESFESGLERTVAWYLENESWWKRLRNEKYGGERLGLAR